MSADSGEPRQRTVAELLAANGGEQSGRRRRRRSSEDGDPAVGAPPASGRPEAPGALRRPVSADRVRAPQGSGGWSDANPRPEHPSFPSRLPEPDEPPFVPNGNVSNGVARRAAEMPTPPNGAMPDGSSAFGGPNGVGSNGHGPQAFGRRPGPPAPEPGYGPPQGYGGRSPEPRRGGMFDEGGYDDGYGRNGYDRREHDRNGYDSNGHDRNGYDRREHDRNGHDRNGHGGYGRNGYDSNGHDRNGYDRNGYDRNGHGGYGGSLFDRPGHDQDFESQVYDRGGYDGSDEHPTSLMEAHTPAVDSDGGPPTQIGAPPLGDLDEDAPQQTWARPVTDAGPPTGAYDPFAADEDYDSGEWARPTDDYDSGEWARPTAAVAAPDRLDYDEYDEYEDQDDSDYDDEPRPARTPAPAGLDDTESGAAGTGQAWAVVIAQWIGGAVAGAAIWVLFRFLWSSLPIYALAGAVVLTLCLVLGVRRLLRNDELKSTLFTVLVGLLLTVSPAILVLLDR